MITKLLFVLMAAFLAMVVATLLTVLLLEGLS